MSSEPSTDSDSFDDSLVDGASSISQIFTHANEFEKVLQGINEPKRSSGLCGIDHLVAKDLNSNERAIVDRTAQLGVTGDTWTDGDLTTEPESFSEGSIDTVSEPSNPEFHRTATVDGDSWKLEPDEIIRLLVKEFGPLTSEGEEERLIFEADAFMLMDVTILGVIHLTTHRLAFHASLLSARPDLPLSQQIIKAGPVTITHKGALKKRRFWIELSHDMLCSYASSSDEDRIRPIRSILLSSIQKVLPYDPKSPTCVQIVTTEGSTGIAECETEEAARDWWKELTGAIFLDRHRRREALGNPDSDASSGIRVSCPLHQIYKITRTSKPFLTAIHIIPSDGSESVREDQLLLGPILALEIPAWQHLEDYIDIAKRRHNVAEAPVFVDFGPLTFSENPPAQTNDPVVNEKERLVRTALSLGNEPDLWIVRARNLRGICSSGYFVVSPHYVGFWSKYCTMRDLKYRLPARIIKSAKPVNGKFHKIHGLTIELEGNPNLSFQFKTQDLRDDAIERINTVCAASAPKLSALPSEEKLDSRFSSSTSLDAGEKAIALGPSAVDVFAPPKRSQAVAKAAGIPVSIQLKLPKVINLERGTLVTQPPLHFVCLTIGSRGDVQPYIALGLGLKKERHRVTIVTHQEYKEWIEGFGLEHKQAGGDPGALMKLSVENKMFSPEFFKKSLANFRPWLDQLLLDAWESCQGADVLLESPSAMAGVHIAEALRIPIFRCFTMPWTKTSEFPQAFLSPPVDSPTFNSASYVLFDNVMWVATSGQINRWRRNTLNIGNTDMGTMMPSKIVFIYNFSQAVVPKPLDWGDTTTISGYWFLDNPDLNWKPPASLIEWMDKARSDGKPIVYIGFGSITVPHPNRVTARIVQAVLKSDVRAIISKGWSARMSKDTDKDPVPTIPPECYVLDKVPHDWLFPRVDAALHHGGAGTTGASLRAGIPTLIKPWFGDQYFWASRVQKLGAGLRVSSLRVHDIADALKRATSNRIMKEKAAAVGEKIRAEDGVRNAIYTIYTYLPRASRDRSLLD